MKLTAHQIYRLKNSFRRLFKLILVVAFIAVMRLRACQNDDNKQLQHGREVQSGNGQELTTATLAAYDNTTRIWQLKTKKLIQNREIKQIKIAPVDLNMYSDTGTVTTHVLSDSGITTEKMESFFIWGHVVITDEDGNTIRSKSLSWDKKERRLHSDDYVEIATVGGEVLRGKGFNAAEDFSWWEFHEDVTGKFTNFDDELGFENEKENEKEKEEEEK